MKKFLLIASGAGLCSLLSASVSSAQDLTPDLGKAAAFTNAGANIYGKITDTVLNGAVPLNYGTVTLMTAGAKDGIDQTIDSTGHFSFSGIKAGQYTLIVSYPGLADARKEVSVAEEAVNIDLGAVYLKADFATDAGKEVKVTSFKEVIEQRPDGLVYKAENDFTNKGGNAADVLRKTPLVTVDLEGNVQLRGNGNVRVFINNKPSTMIAASVKDVLRQIPSDQIKSVEVITNPGAKYDAEGAAGVINIMLKKNIMKGFSGTVFASYSYRFKNNQNLGNIGTSLNYHYKNLGVSLSVGGARWGLPMDATTSRIDNPGTSGESVLKQTMANTSIGNFGMANLNTDYQIDSTQSVSFGVNYSPGTWNSDIHSTTQLPSQNVDFIRNTNQKGPRGTVGLNGGYSKHYKDNPQHTLDFLANYSIGRENANYNLDQLSPSNALQLREQSKNHNINNELTVQGDYVLPLKGHNQKIETGAKYINRYINSDYFVADQANGTGDYVTDPARSNNLKYTQHVGALYAQYSRDLTAKLSGTAGLRYEYTHINANLRDNGGSFGSDYNNLVPNVILSYDLGNFNKLKLAYNLRIERPSIDFVNPYINYTDPYNLTQGNQYLVPEKTHNAELGYSTYLGQTSLNLSLFYRYTGNGIDKISSVDANNISHTTYQNIDKSNIWGANVFTSATLFRKLQLRVNGNLYYKNLKSPSLGLKNTGWQYDGNLYATYRITNTLSLAGFGMYNGNNVSLQGHMDGWYYYFFGAQYQLLKGKASIMLAAENIFSSKSKMTWHYQYGNSVYDMTSYYNVQALKLTFSYSFGKMSYSQKKSVDNDDLKKNNGNIGGGMGGM